MQQAVTQPLFSSRKKRRGFTLTEMAIVLGVIGLILGAIWVAAANVYSNMRVEKAQQQILTIVQNIRSLYVARSTFADPASACGVNCPQDITAPMASAGVFPADMVTQTAVANNKATYPQSPWGTPVTIYSDGMSVDGDSFELQVDGNLGNTLASSCQSLLGRMVGPGMDSGLTGVADGAVVGWMGGSANNSAYVQTLDATSFAGCKYVVFMFRLKG